MITDIQAMEHYNAHYNNATYRAIQQALELGGVCLSAQIDFMNMVIDASLYECGYPDYCGTLGSWISAAKERLQWMAHVCCAPTEVNRVNEAVEAHLANFEEPTVKQQYEQAYRLSRLQAQVMKTPCWWELEKERELIPSDISNRARFSWHKRHCFDPLTRSIENRYIRHSWRRA